MGPVQDHIRQTADFFQPPRPFRMGRAQMQMFLRNPGILLRYDFGCHNGKGSVDDLMRPRQLYLILRSVIGPGHQPELLSVHGAADFLSTEGPAVLIQRSLLQGAHHPDRSQGIAFRPGDHRNLFLDDAGFLQGNFFYCISQHPGVIQGNIGNHGNQRLN